MALWVRGWSKCPICDKVIDQGEVVSFWAFIGDRQHPLWRFSDSTMHRECFIAWPDRDAFIALHNAFFLERPRADGRCRRICEDGTYVWFDPETGDAALWD